MPLRVVFAEDNYLAREGIAALLSEVGGVDLVATVSDLDGLLEAVGEHEPDGLPSFEGGQEPEDSRSRASEAMRWFAIGRSAHGRDETRHNGSVDA